jgi:formamidopyrimidine-DNA glycosylase
MRPDLTGAGSYMGNVPGERKPAGKERVSMPELPEVETVRRGLAPTMEGARIVAVEQRRPDLRFPLPEQFAARLTGRRIVALGRRAKYLIADLDDGAALISHLGMSGSFRIEEGEAGHVPGRFHHERSKLAAHDHVVFDLERADGRSAKVIYNDPRRFGFMDLVPDRQALETHPYFLGLGPEPTGNDLGAGYLASRFAGRSAPLKAALLDQRLVAGLGNIYVCEALWRAGLSPRRSRRLRSRPRPPCSARRRGSRRLAQCGCATVIADAIASRRVLACATMSRPTARSAISSMHFSASTTARAKPCPRPGCGDPVSSTASSRADARPSIVPTLSALTPRRSEGGAMMAFETILAETQRPAWRSSRSIRPQALNALNSTRCFMGVTARGAPGVRAPTRPSAPS